MAADLDVGLVGEPLGGRPVHPDRAEHAGREVVGPVHPDRVWWSAARSTPGSGTASCVAPIWAARCEKPLSSASDGGAARGGGADATQVVLPGRARCRREHRRGDRGQLRIQLRASTPATPGSDRGGPRRCRPGRGWCGCRRRAGRAPRCPDRRAEPRRRPATRRRPPAIAGQARTGRRAGHRRAPRCAAAPRAPVTASGVTPAALRACRVGGPGSAAAASRAHDSSGRRSFPSTPAPAIWVVGVTSDRVDACRRSLRTRIRRRPRCRRSQRPPRHAGGSTPNSTGRR